EAEGQAAGGFASAAGPASHGAGPREGVGDRERDFKKSDGLLREAAPVRYAFIEQHRGELPVGTMCRVLKVSRSGYYDWRIRREAAPGPRRARQDELTCRIRQVHATSRGLYGSPRVHAELKVRGVAVCQNTVARYMRQAGIASRARKRFVVLTTDSNHAHAVASNTLKRR